MRLKVLILLLLLTVSPAVSWAATPPVAQGADLDKDAEYIKQWIKMLPAWMAADEAYYEQPELAAVQQDIDDCINAVDVEAFKKFVKQLETDSDKLKALDNKLTKEIQL